MCETEGYLKGLSVAVLFCLRVDTPKILLLVWFGCSAILNSTSDSQVRGWT